MSMDDALRDTIAESLWSAREQGRAIPPISESYPGLTLDDAYDIQRAGRARVLEHHRVGGHKIGLTSAAMRAQFGVDEPDFGVLFDGMFVRENLPVSMGTLIAPRVESEIAFLLLGDLVGPGVDAETVLAATAGVFPAIEIIDSRIEQWRINLVDTVADNASSGLVVLGTTVTPVAGLDLATLNGSMRKNGTVVGEGSGADSMGHPAAAVAWLANTLAGFGERLQAGDIVLSGSVHSAVEVHAGDSVTVEFDALGTVRTRFVE